MERGPKAVLLFALLLAFAAIAALAAPGAGPGQAAAGGPAPAERAVVPSPPPWLRVVRPREGGVGRPRPADSHRVVASNDKRDNLPFDDTYRSLSVWADDRNGNWDLYAQVLRADGSPNGVPHMLVAFPGDQLAPALALDSLNERYLLAWQDGDGSLYGWLVARDGSLAGHWQILSSGPGVRSAPALAYDPVGHQYLLAWQYCAAGDGAGGCAGGWAVYARLLDPGGRPEGEEVRLSSAGAKATAPAVEWAGAAGEYRVNWLQAGEFHDALYRCDLKACRDSGLGSNSALTTLSSTPLPTTTPLPWDDVQVSDRPSLVGPQSLAVVGNEVYVVHDQSPGWVYFTRSVDGGYTFLPSIVVGNYGGMTSIARREGAGLEDRDLYVSFYLAQYIYFTRSTDGGASWIWPVVVQTSPDNGQLFVPKIAVDTQGVIYITWCHNHDGNGCDLGLSRSFDGGVTWLEPIQVVPFLTRMPFWVQGCSLVGRNGSLYFAWNNGQQFLFTRSTDGGQTWSDPVQLDDGNDQLFHGAIDLTVDSKGVLYTAWDDDRLGRPITFVARSTDSGTTWSSGVRVDDGKCVQLSWSGAITMDDTELGQRDVLVALMDGRHYCEASWNYSDLFLTRSRDQGRSWSLNEQVSNPIPYNNMGDASIQTWGGAIYTVWDEYSSGEPNRHVMLDVHVLDELPMLTPTPTGSPTSTSTPTPSSSPTATPTRSPSPLPTPAVSATPTPTSSPSPMVTATATLAASPGPTATAPCTPSPTPRAEWRVYLPAIEVRRAGTPNIERR